MAERERIETEVGTFEIQYVDPPIDGGYDSVGAWGPGDHADGPQMPYPPHGSLAWMETGEPDYESDLPDEDRDELGRMVRRIWVQWALEQPNPKPTWLVGWEDLSEPDREVDRRIGEALFNEGWAAGWNRSAVIAHAHIQIQGEIMTTIHTSKTVDHDLTGVHPSLGEVTVTRSGFHPVVKVVIAARILGASDMAHGAVLADPLTITAAPGYLREIAQGILDALDEHAEEIEHVASTPPHGQTHGS